MSVHGDRGMLDDSGGWEEVNCEKSPVHHLGEEVCDELLYGGEIHSEDDTSQSKEIEKKEYTDLPEWLQILLEGVDVPLNTNVPIDTCPEWLDMDKVLRGRRFAVENLFGLVYAEMLSLAILLSLRRSLEPLIYTGKSSTPFTSYQRYLRTVLRICSWYYRDPWESGSEARRHLAEVRTLHASVAKRMNSSPPYEIRSKVTLKGQRLWCPMTEDIRKDFEESGMLPAEEDCPFAAIQSLSRRSDSEVLYFNQMDLSITQFGFVGLVILHPRKFGMHGCTEEDLESFIHLWRALGKALGIEDRYNLCSGTLDETRRRCSQLVEIWFKPNLLEVNEEWEHLYRCIVEGIRYYVPWNTFAVALCYLCDVLEIPMPRLCASMRWKERLLFHAHKFIFRFFMRFARVRRYYNKMLSLALKKASNASTEYLQRLQEKKYQYMWDA